ncbi:Uncharacterised protein [Mycobacteroides abscessus subsp. abscessus]|nr:Uncharacterised protein [Mycobacteroides abscessus subsp. abscessus]
MSRAAYEMTPRLVRGTWVSGGALTEWLSTADTMRAMVRTASSGYLPTEVSPDSITASAPSRTALATSEASARVGREFSIIDSSIWVATMTGRAFSRAIWIARFCTMGTSSSGSSTPRSPRATMIASKANTIASRLATASGFSSLAITGTRRPTRSMTACTNSTSLGERTKDRAMRSTPSRSANSKSAMSFSERAGTETFMPGSDNPLLLLTGPPSVTRQTTSSPSIASTVRPTLPSSTRSLSPTAASAANCL